MHLVQLLLPLYRSDGGEIPHRLFEDVRKALIDRFGGLTAYTRSPAKGLWQEPEGTTVRDDVVIYEVMVEALDRQWWAQYRTELEARFDQQELIVRASEVIRL